MPERPKGADCKSAGNAFGGSNPSPSTNAREDEATVFHSGWMRDYPSADCPLSSVVERLHGKEEVVGSIPTEGSVSGGSPPEARLSFANGGRSGERCDSIGRRFVLREAKLHAAA